ncbi:MAG: hypothetical protein KAV87_67775 [Desulfobacteraceae bacterium]|nr:hypothetical protein [Desulfobacteraceae bacterium]
MERNVLTNLFVCTIIMHFTTTAWTAMLVGTTSSGGTPSPLREIGPAAAATLINANWTKGGKP